MIQRITTNGMMNRYKTNLMKSYNTLATASERLNTERNFNSYAENPTKAAQAFQLRRNRWNVENQIANTKQVVHKFQQAWDCLDDTYQDLGVKLGKYSALRADNDADAGGRSALGEVLKGAAESVMQTMNAKYGQNFVFSGADGERVPFEWGPNGEVMYRGMPVDVAVPTEAELADGSWKTALNDPNDQNSGLKYQGYMDIVNSIENEHTFVDLGMGMKEDNGQLIEASAFDTALNGADFIGYGHRTVTLNSGKEVMVPKNIISILNQMGEVFSACSPEDGSYSDTPITTADGKQVSQEEMAEALQKALEDSLDDVHSKWIAHDTRSTFIETNADRLDSLDDSLNEQITTIEDIDPADAITALMWAQYSYNAALRIGTNLLSQSLIDYMN